MRNLVIILLLWLTTSNNVLAQNKLPLVWDISTNLKEQKVNLLLSWERQNLSYLDENYSLSTHFSLINRNKDYVLAVCMRANVAEIKINNQLIGGPINSSFQWSANPNYEIHEFKVPSNIIKENNYIEVTGSSLSYTGGHSWNSVKLFPTEKTKSSSIETKFSNSQHLFKSQHGAFTIISESPTPNTLNVTVRNDYSDTISTQSFPIKTGITTTSINMKALEPGFYEVISTLDESDKCGNVSWFAVSPTLIENTNQAPANFHFFWDKALDELKTIEPKFKIEKQEHLCTPKRTGYIAEFQSLKNQTIKAYYFVPKSEGKHAAILNLPGYGYGFENMDEFKSNNDNVIEMALCVRGHGISSNAINTEPTGFFGHNIYDKDKTAYREIYMDCVRAIEFLLSREEVDKSKIGVVGMSQGGGLTLATAGLASKHVSACAFFDPFPTDIPNMLRTRKMIKTEIEGFVNYYSDSCNYTQALNTLNYLDTKHFAERISCPTLFLTGLFDDDCPSRVGFSAFNEITAPKEFIIFPNDSHIAESNYKSNAMDFFRLTFNY